MQNNWLNWNQEIEKKYFKNCKSPKKSPRLDPTYNGLYNTLKRIRSTRYIDLLT